MPETTEVPRGVGTSGRHVCVLTTAHPADDVRVNSKIAASFLSRGYQVSWVGPRSSYFTDSVRVDDRIDYRFVKPNRSRLDRLAASRRVKRAALSLAPVDWWYSPDPDAAEVCISLARERGGQVLFDVHEVFHGALLDRYLFGRQGAIVRRYVRRRVARTCQQSDLVIGVNRSVLEPYVDDWSRACIVRNCAPMWFSEGTGALNDSPGRLKVMHGKALLSNGTPTVLAALEVMQQTAQAPRVVMFAGMGRGKAVYSTSLGGQLDKLRLAGLVELREGVPHREVPALLASCDVGMVAYGRGLGEDSLPNRLFEYMATGLAILAPSYAREICEIIIAEDIGLTADFDDPWDVSRALEWVAEHPDEIRAMGRRARAAFLTRYHWDAEFDRLIDAMNERG